MKHLQLQPRLRLLADMVPAGAHLADIGTDHGYLPVWLMQQGRIASAIAADIGPEPLAHARRTAAEYGADEEFAAQGAALSTIACFVVIPVLMLIL